MAQHTQPPSANKKKQYEIRNIIVTGLFGKDRGMCENLAPSTNTVNMPQTAHPNLATLEADAVLPARPRHPERLVPNHSAPSTMGAIPPLWGRQARPTRGYSEEESQGGMRKSYRTRCGFSSARIVRHRASLSLLLSCIPFPILRANAIAFLSSNRILFSLGRISRVLEQRTKYYLAFKLAVGRDVC